MEYENLSICTVKLFISFSIICLLLIVGINVFYTYYSTRSQQSSVFAQDVNSKIQLELLKAEIELDGIKTRILDAQHVNFTTIVTPSQYPYFVYKDKKLLFWSDYRVSSDYSYLEGNYKEKLVSLRNNKFLVKRQKFKKNKLAEYLWIGQCGSHGTNSWSVQTGKKYFVGRNESGCPTKSAGI